MADIDRGLFGKHDYLQMFISLFVIAVLALSLMVTSFYELIGPGYVTLEPPSSVVITYVAHAPILIEGDGGFLGPNATTGISWGNGTESNPYIIDNWKINASTANGIEIRNSTAHFIIGNCYIYDGEGSFNGIILFNVVNGTVSSNKVSDNVIGILLSTGSNNRLINNTGFNQSYGIFSASQDNLTIIGNIMQYNYYGIHLWSTNNSNLSNNNCSNNEAGIMLSSSNNNSLINNIGLANYVAIYLWLSSNNSFSNNTCSNSIESGIFLWSSSNNNMVQTNRFENNTHFGIHISLSSNNMIWNNTFMYNYGSGTTYDPTRIQAYDDGSDNLWNSTFGFGNYWRDWTTPDVVPPLGIVDIPYLIAGSGAAKDFLPRTTPWIIPEPSIIILMGIMIVLFLMNGRTRKKK